MVNIHATCIVLADAATAFKAPKDAGVLLLGESGSGKSDLALRLMERGAKLVADDRVELFARDGLLMARAPETIPASPPAASQPSRCCCFRFSPRKGSVSST